MTEVFVVCVIPEKSLKLLVLFRFISSFYKLQLVQQLAVSYVNIYTDTVDFSRNKQASSLVTCH